MEKSKIGFLFGAGAEAGYGMPLGGKFALGIFRAISEYKTVDLNEGWEQSNCDSYVSSWLPEDIKAKRILKYTSTDLEIILRDTIENNDDVIVKELDRFDELSTNVIKKLKERNVDVDKAFEDIGIQVNSIDKSNCVRLNEFLSDNGSFFSQSYFCALMEAVNASNVDDYVKELKDVIITLIQLRVLVLGKRISAKMSDQLFYNKKNLPEYLNEVSSALIMDYRSSGQRCISKILKKYRELNTDELTPYDIITRFANEVLDEVFSKILSYKTLIDANWHYLYSPSKEWSKFSKIATFLYVVRKYIKEKRAQINDNQGYYEDIKQSLKSGNISNAVFATTNYSDLICSKLDVKNNEIAFLNGSVFSWYDPYLNEHFESNNDKELFLSEEGHIVVPLLFSQSGVKPMTSIVMAKKYLDMYNQFKGSDCICTIGYGFNSDDDHINEIIRKLIVKNKKKLVVISNDDSLDEGKIKKNLKIKPDVGCIDIIIVNEKRKTKGNVDWVNAVISLIGK